MLALRAVAKRRARENGGKVVVHPVAIKYIFNGDIKDTCDNVLSDIERVLTWRTQPELPLVQRIVKVGNALLSLKELVARGLWQITEDETTARSRGLGVGGTVWMD